MKNILKKLHAIMSEVDRIEKDGYNKFHKYNYASEKIIKETLHEQLVKNRVLFYITAAEQSVMDVKLESGKPERLTSIILTYRFCDVDSEEYIEGQGVGQGQDPGDKGSYKAITGALKYILTTSFLIPTGDDPEGDNGTDTRSAAPAKAKTNNAGKTPEMNQQELAVQMVRDLFQKLPPSKKTLDVMKTILPINDFAQVQVCTIDQLNTGIDRLNELLTPTNGVAK